MIASPQFKRGHLLWMTVTVRINVNGIADLVIVAAPFYVFQTSSVFCISFSIIRLSGPEYLPPNVLDVSQVQ